MDFGLLFRKRTATSKQFVQLLLERNNFLQKELPLDILLSYIFSLVISKLLSTPLEISEIVCQALPPSTPRSFFSSVLLPSLIDSRRRGIIVAGLGVDLLSNLCNVIAENLIFDKLSEGKSRYMKKKMSLQNGVIAKVAALIATFPLDLLRTRKVLNEFKVLPDLSNSFSDALRDSYTVSSIGSGLKPAIAKVAIFVFIKEFFLRQFKVIEKKRDPLDIAPRDTVSKFSKYLMMDYLSGILSEIAIFPLSVIITKLMHSGNNVGMWETIVSTWQKERLKGFFGGLGYHISQSLVIYFSTMLAFLISRTIVSRVKKILREDMDESKDDSREEL